MRIITALFAILFIAILITGCGPHFNRFAKPDTWTEPAPPVAVDVRTPEEQIVPKTATLPETVTLTIPNWPTYAYAYGDNFILLIVRDTKTFPVPKEFEFKSSDGNSFKMPMVTPKPKEQPK